MPVKLGKGGKGLEDFDPETGEYTAGASISKRGDNYWVHGDLRSRKITKEEYDDFKAAGYKEDFDADTKKYKLYKDGEWQSTQYKRIKDMVSKMPNQSVCFCSVKWRGCNSAHVFIVHNDNGNVSFIDPQDNSDASEYFDKSKHTIEARWTKLIRINDFSLNGEVLPYIVRKEGTAKNEYEDEQSQLKSI